MEYLCVILGSLWAHLSLINFNQAKLMDGIFLEAFPIQVKLSVTPKNVLTLSNAMGRDSFSIATGTVDAVEDVFEGNEAVDVDKADEIEVLRSWYNTSWLLLMFGAIVGNEETAVIVLAGVIAVLLLLWIGLLGVFAGFGTKDVLAVAIVEDEEDCWTGILSAHVSDSLSGGRFGGSMAKIFFSAFTIWHQFYYIFF